MYDGVKVAISTAVMSNHLSQAAVCFLSLRFSFARLFQLSLSHAVNVLPCNGMDGI